MRPITPPVFRAPRPRGPRSQTACPAAGPAADDDAGRARRPRIPPAPAGYPLLPVPGRSWAPSLSVPGTSRPPSYMPRHWQPSCGTCPGHQPSTSVTCPGHWQPSCGTCPGHGQPGTDENARAGRRYLDLGALRQVSHRYRT